MVFENLTACRSAQKKAADLAVSLSCPGKLKKVMPFSRNIRFMMCWTFADPLADMVIGLAVKYPELK
jgi:hypothetical protein